MLAGQRRDRPELGARRVEPVAHAKLGTRAGPAAHTAENATSHCGRWPCDRRTSPTFRTAQQTPADHSGFAIRERIFERLDMVALIGALNGAQLSRTKAGAPR